MFSEKNIKKIFNFKILIKMKLQDKRKGMRSIKIGYYGLMGISSRMKE